jgi:flagellar hook-associated protein 3 FlgL
MVEYKKEDNPIDYTVSFNQTIRINTEASEVFDSRMARYIDDMISNLQKLDASDAKIANIEKMMKEARYSDEANQADLETMLNAAKKERDLLDDKTQKLFERNIGIWQGYLDKVDLAITDCGSRASRVELTESRMASQQATFKKLKSTNEDRELSEIIIDFTSAQTAYQSSLKATSKALQQTLLDFI